MKCLTTAVAVTVWLALSWSEAGARTLYVSAGNNGVPPAYHDEVIGQIVASEPHIVLHVGDFVEHGGTYTQWWDYFFSDAQPLMKNVAMFETLGNHEYLGGDTTGSKYHAFFDLPETYIPRTGQNTEKWYSFDYSNAHVICLDTCRSGPDFGFAPGSDQWKWLIGDPEGTGDLPVAKQRKEDPNDVIDWIFVFFHHPPYSSGKAHGGDAQVETTLVPEFHEYHVDIVFAGHDHIYERIRREAQGWTVRYIVTGGGGAPLHEAWPDPPYSGQATREWLYAKNYAGGPGLTDPYAFHLCVLEVAGSALQFNMYRWNGDWKDGFTLP